MKENEHFPWNSILRNTKIGEVRFSTRSLSRIRQIIEEEISSLFFFFFFFFIARKLNWGEKKIFLLKDYVSPTGNLSFTILLNPFSFTIFLPVNCKMKFYEVSLETYVLWTNLKNHMEDREQWKKQSELREKRSRRHFLISFFSTERFDLLLQYRLLSLLKIVQEVR